MGRRLCMLLLTGSLFLLLSGCFFKSPDDLYAVPKPPEDFENLQATIDEVRAAGAEYAAPLTGTYTQTVQLRDLDGDGVQEAIVFFRFTTTTTTTAVNVNTPGAPGVAATTTPVLAGGRPLKIYIFRQAPGDRFEVQSIIEGGDGISAINSVSYEDLDGDGVKEMIVNWEFSNKVYLLSAYTFRSGEAQEILRESYNETDFAILDLDKDNVKEVVILSVNTVEGIYKADLYDYDGERGELYLAASAPMTKGFLSLADVRSKWFIKGAGPDTYEPALFVTSNASVSEGDGVVTDIFAWRDGGLVNLTLNPETGVSEGTYRNSLSNFVGLRDINNDMILELPRPMAFPDPRKLGADNFWSVQWMQYNILGEATPIFTTYFNGEDGWYFILPDHWAPLISPQGRGEKITLARRDVTGSGERAVVFSLWNGSVVSEPMPFLTIYKLTGPNRITRSLLGGRFVLAEERDVVYAAEFYSGGWDCGLTKEMVTERFQLIQPE